jgi:hypothetical protein
MKTVRKVQVNAKLAKRNYKRADNLTKGGIIFMATFILPCVVMLLTNLKSNPSFGLMG